MQCWFLMLLILLASQLNAQVTLLPKPLMNNLWSADSLYVGAGLFAVSEDLEITVTLEFTFAMDSGQKVYLRLDNDPVPRFLFSTRFDNFDPQNPKVLNLGRFPRGTALHFMLVAKSSIDDSFDTLYSGQNRVGIDQYVSNKSYSYGRRWAAAGRINDTHVEMGFDYRDPSSNCFWDVVFSVDNVFLEVLEKFKVPRPTVLISADNMSSTSLAQLYVQNVGNFIVYGVPGGNVFDTVRYSFPFGEDFKIHYTVDGTDPRLVSASEYDLPFSFTESLTLRTVAELPNDTNWFKSEELVGAYASNAVAVKIPKVAQNLAQNMIYGYDAFDLVGRRIPYADQNLVAKQLLVKSDATSLARSFVKLQTCR